MQYRIDFACVCRCSSAYLSSNHRTASDANHTRNEVFKFDVFYAFKLVLGAVHKRRPHSGGEGGLIDLRAFADKGGGGVSGMRTSIFQLFPRRKIADCFIPFSVFRASVNHA